MRRHLFLSVLILALLLVAAVGYQQVADAEAEAGEESSLEEAIIGIWKFPVDGYYFGFDADGRLCYGGSGESVAAKAWCNKYAVQDGIVTETCMGGPEDRNCPLGGGSCKARVSVDEEGQLMYRILLGQCDMQQYKLVPPRQYLLTER